jgi:aminoglycoside phosphotransferase (APT) family kinase protein
VPESKGDPLAALAGRIEEYFSHKMPQAGEVAVRDLQRIPGGNSKENLSFVAGWVENGEEVQRQLLVRRELPAGVLETKAETEYLLMKALWDTDIPVPRMYWSEKDPRWLDQPFFVEEFVGGESSLESLAKLDPRVRDEIVRDFVETLARQHRLDWRKLGLEFLGVPADADDCAQRQIDHWMQVLERHRLDPQPLLTALFRWLRQHKPHEVSRIALVHGDPGPGNFLVRDGRITAVVDWELAHLGDPMDDLGWLCWRAGSTGSLFDREKLVELYAKTSSIPLNLESLRYYEVFSNVRAAVACVSGLRSFCEGTNMQLNMAVVGLGIYRASLLEGARLAGFPSVPG